MFEKLEQDLILYMKCDTGLRLSGDVLVLNIFIYINFVCKVFRYEQKNWILYKSIKSKEGYSKLLRLELDNLTEMSSILPISGGSLLSVFEIVTLLEVEKIPKLTSWDFEESCILGD